MYHSIYNNLNLHVAASPREVIRTTLGRLKKRCRYARKSRGERHKLLRAMLREHRDAGKLYLEVMSGRVG